MSILKQIEARKAYRALDSRPIATDILERLAAAAHLAPSSANNQPWRIVTVTEPARLAALKETFTPGNYWAKTSPAVAAFASSAEWSMRPDGRELAWFELGMAAMAYQLQAVEEGLYVHPIVGFNAAAAKDVIGIPGNVTLQILIVLGYPGDRAILNEKHLASELSPRIRKPIGQIAAFETWNEALMPQPKA